MFRFNFEEDDAKPAQRVPACESDVEPCYNTPLVELLDCLPSLLSYSPLKVPLPARRSELVFPRRDLFDARLQLISTDDKNIEGLEFLDAPSDLAPGIYEGGLKTWECSLDLVDVLDTAYCKDETQLIGKRILEIGCGTAIPSLYLLRRIFSSPSQRDNPETHFHLQDFNRSVLELVTLPNIILTWYMSSASESYRDVLHRETTESDPDPDIHPLPPADPTDPSELPVNPSLIAAFLQSLMSFNVHLHFTYGPWSTFNPESHFDITLTSETIYRPESLPSLLDVMWKAYKSPQRPNRTLDELAASQLALDDSDFPACYVASKILYFGVGGGIPNFLEAVENPSTSTSCSREKGKVETIREHTEGVGRRVMRIRWG